jgi:hypothetical protein
VTQKVKELSQRRAIPAVDLDAASPRSQIPNRMLAGDVPDGDGLLSEPSAETGGE